MNVLLCAVVLVLVLVLVPSETRRMSNDTDFDFDFADADADADACPDGFFYKDPSNGIRIISATYGANCGVDSLQKKVFSSISHECEGRINCLYLITTTRIGDPAVGCEKSYNVTYKCSDTVHNGGHRTVTVAKEAHGRTIGLYCPELTKKINIIAAVYGNNCGVRQCTGRVCSNIDAMCRGKAICNYRINAHVIGDPAYLCKKSYIVKYFCGCTKIAKTARVYAEAHGQRAVLKCPDRH